MKIIGRFRKEIFSSDKGYIIGLFKVQDIDNEELKKYLDKTITFTGYFHELNDQDIYEFTGNLVNHEKYGEQFQVTSYERIKPEGKNAIIEFLTSGLFKGIGEKKAKSLTDALGEDTLKVILNNPENLILIPGITKQNIDVLHNKLKEYESSYEIVMYLQELGFSTRDSITIYNKYKNKTKSIIEEDIYQLVIDILEISFKKVDLIALNSGIDKNSIIRLRASILYIMNELTITYGHSYYYLEELVMYLKRLLKIDIEEESFKEAITSLVKDLLLVVEDDKYYLKDMYEAEHLISRRMKLLSHVDPHKYKKIDKVLEDVEDRFNIKYNDDQLQAIKSAIEEKLLIITGGPGTGKTTIMKGIIEAYRELEKLSYSSLLEKVALLAPTGRAAKRMSEETSLPAYTIHRFLKWNKESNKFQINEYHKSKVEFIIVDEASMVDTLLFSSLLKGISVNTKIILVGDDEQLPSVGAGNVLHDLINSNVIRINRLTKLYRQSSNSNIIKLAYDIRGESINYNNFNKDEDLTFIESNEIDIIKEIEEIAKTYQDVSYKDFQILVPMYKGINGIDNINEKIKDIYNPKSNDKKEIVIGDTNFRENDKVIQLTNQPEDNIYNGDIGIIDKIVTGSKKEIYIDYDGNIVKYVPSSFNNFRLAYAISIHKSQGSEFDYVVLPIIRSYNRMLYKKLIYTAVTRSKKNLYIIGSKSSLDLAIKNNTEGLRRTTIEELLTK
jgi:exodeoxyribonuclease V alpha subunit